MRFLGGIILLVLVALAQSKPAEEKQDLPTNEVDVDKQEDPKIKELEKRINELEQNIPKPAVTAWYSFYARRSEDYTTGDGAVPFDDVLTNVGSAYTGSSGIFTCAIRGLYEFNTNIRQSEDNGLIYIMVNDIPVCRHNSGDVDYSSMTCTTVLELQVGDQVYVRGDSEASNSLVMRGIDSTFSGHLIMVCTDETCL